MKGFGAIIGALVTVIIILVILNTANFSQGDITTTTRLSTTTREVTTTTASTTTIPAASTTIQATSTTALPTTTSTTTTTQSTGIYSIPHPIPGMSGLNITPAQKGTAIYLDNIYSGLTPKYLDNVAPGEHRLVLSKSGFTSYSIKFFIDNSSIYIFNVELGKVASATVHIDSEPSGAAITIDSKPYGVTPGTIEGLTIGEHKIILVLNGYYDYNQFVVLEEENSLNVTLNAVS